jgi:hypothetical protein
MTAYRHINGSSLNGREYNLNVDGRVLSMLLLLIAASDTFRLFILECNKIGVELPLFCYTSERDNSTFLLFGLHGNHGSITPFIPRSAPRSPHFSERVRLHSSGARLRFGSPPRCLSGFSRPPLCPDTCKLWLTG